MGWFDKFYGEIERTDGTSRVTVLLDLLMRKVPVTFSGARLETV